MSASSKGGMERTKPINMDQEEGDLDNRRKLFSRTARQMGVPGKDARRAESGSGSLLLEDYSWNA